MTFTDKIEAQTPLSTDHSLIKEWLDSDTARHLQSLKGHTAMYSGILAAEKRLEPTLPGDAIYIVTGWRGKFQRYKRFEH